MFQNNLLMAAASISAGGLTVDNSVRYNDADSPYLYRTPAIAGNQVMGSLSLWYKRCNLGYIMQLFNSGAGNDITFNASDQLTFIDSSGVSYITTQVFRDPTAWGHLLFAWNTSNATAGNRLRIYHNGIEITAFGTETDPSAGDTFGISKGDTRKTVGANESNTEEFDGYLSQVYLVDGQQLTPASFGETDDNGVWRPIAYSAGGSTASALSIAFTDSAVDDTTGSTFTFSSVDIGTAASDRKVVVAVGGQVAGSTQTSVTVGGESCTLAAVHSASQVGRVAFWEIDLATGTSEDIVVVFGQNNNCAGIGVWALTGDMVVYDTIKDSRAGNPTGEITCPAGSVIMGYELINVSPNRTFTWAGLTENFDAVQQTNQAMHTGASGDFSEAQDDLTITVTPSSEGAAPTAAAQAMVVICYAPTATTYGTTGFKLDFEDSSDFGNDVSGNSNDYTSSGLAADDQVSDTPTKNYATYSTVWPHGGALSNGNLRVTGSSYDGAGTTQALFDYAYWEVEGISTSAMSEYRRFTGICTAANDVDDNAGDGSTTRVGMDTQNAFYNLDGSGLPTTTYSGTWAVGDELCFAVRQNGADVDIWIRENSDAFFEGGDPAAGTTPTFTWTSMVVGDLFAFSTCYNSSDIIEINFGQKGFAHTPPTGFKAVNTANIATPTILDGTANFQTTLYTGDGSTRNIDQTENSTFQPDMVWIKNRSAADNHMVIDAARGVTKEVNTNNGAEEITDANGLTSFDSDGFGLGTGAGGYNDNTESFVAWQWLAGGGAGSSNTVGSTNTITTTVNTTAGISIGTYTGTGAVATIGHGLGVAPGFITVKELDDGTNQWITYHVGNNVPRPAEDGYLAFNESQGGNDYSIAWNDTAPTSTVFTIGTQDDVNDPDNTYVCYVFAAIEGFSSFSNYLGNGLADGPFVYIGFKPAFVIIKAAQATGDWVMYDSQRSPYNEIDDQLLVNTDAAETTGSEEIDFLSNGFKIRTDDGNVNTSAGSYVYLAFAEYPFGGEDVTPATAF